MTVFNKNDSTPISSHVLEEILASGKLATNVASVQLPGLITGNDWLIFINGATGAFSVAQFGGGANPRFSINPFTDPGGQKSAIGGAFGTTGWLGTSTNDLTDGATVTPDAGASTGAGFFWRLGVAGSRTIAQPINLPTGGPGTTGNFISIFQIKNNTAGAITTTFNAFYKLAGAWVDPAAGKSRFLWMVYDGVNMLEISRSAADV